MAKLSPRIATTKNMKVAMPKVNVSRTTNSGKRAPATPKAKGMGDLKALPQNPKPKIPGLVKPLGPSSGGENPEITPINSQRGAKQRVNIKNPMSAI